MASVLGRRSTAEEAVAGHDLSGMTVIVTGGGGGIGAETARVLARAGAEVTIAVRNLDAGRKVAETMNAQIGRSAIEARTLDLANLASVRAFARDWGTRPLNLLINNAGILGATLVRTVDGFESNIGVNYLGHFLLSNLLIPNLESAAPSRIVNLASGAHANGPLDLDDWNYESQPFDSSIAYARSKTANVLGTVAMSARYLGRGITTNAVMPGVIRTGLFRNLDDEGGALLDRLAPYAKTVEQGAATSVWAATADELAGKGGLYLEDCGIAGPYNPESGSLAGVAAHAQDPAIADRLWTIATAAVQA